MHKMHTHAYQVRTQVMNTHSASGSKPTQSGILFPGYRILFGYYFLAPGYSRKSAENESATHSQRRHVDPDCLVSWMYKQEVWLPS